MTFEPAPIIVIHQEQPVPAGYSPVYVGRPSVLGNPYVMQTEADRAEVIARFTTYLSEAMQEHTEQASAVWALAERVRAGERLALQCWCAPKACHGDVIRREIEHCLEG